METLSLGYADGSATPMRFHTQLFAYQLEPVMLLGDVDQVEVGSKRAHEQADLPLVQTRSPLQ